MEVRLSGHAKVKEYLEGRDFDVFENANRYPGPTGLLTYVAEKYLKEEVMYREIPVELARLHEAGLLYVHKLPYSLFIPYCCGHSVARLLEKGLVTPTINARPARHLDTYVDHVANYLMAMQHYFSGAQALGAVELYAGPFIRRDSADYERVKQQVQRLIYNLNFPSRAGMQCLSEDTQILTPDGWKSYRDVKVGDLIYTFNIRTRRIEVKQVRHVFVREYKGKMYNLRNRTQDQLVSPKHRIVWRDFNKDEVRYEPIENLLRYKSPIPLPTPAFTEFAGEDYGVSDDEIRLVAWVLSEGSIDSSGRSTPRVTIIQSEKGHLNEIKALLDRLGLRYEVREDPGWGSAKALRLDAESSRKVLDLLGGARKKPPAWIYRLSRRQARVFLDTYVKGDGWVEKEGDRVKRVRITTTDPEIRDALAALAVIAGYNVSIHERNPPPPSKKVQYIITLTETKLEYIQEIKEVEYEGIIWSVNTENETVIAKRKGCVFITGNTPFTNFTVVLDASKVKLSKDPAYIAGKEVGRIGDYLDEARLFVRAIYEVHSEGDAVGRPFTFPIPTVMTTSKLLYEDPEIFEAVFNAAAKMGAGYWLNTRIVDPDASFAMCLHGSERVVVRENGVVKVMTMKEFFSEYAGDVEAEDPDGAKWFTPRKDVEVLSPDLTSGEVAWRKVRRILVKKGRKAVKVRLLDGRTLLVTPDHPIPVYSIYTRRVRLLPAEKLVTLARKTHRVPVLFGAPKGEGTLRIGVGNGKSIQLDAKFGYFLGVFYGDGTFIRNKATAKKIRDESKVRDGYYLSGIQITVHREDTELRDFIVSYAEEHLGASVKESDDPRWENTHYIWIYNAELARRLYDDGISPYSDERRIPHIIWNAPPEVKEAFIKGLLRSDGHFRKASWELHIKNKELAEDVMLLAAMVGVHAYINENKDGSVTVYFPAKPDGEFLKDGSSKKHHVEGNLAWVGVDSAEVVEFSDEEEFYDVEVEGTHYFVHGCGVVTHNCCRINIDMNELSFAARNGLSSLRLGDLRKEVEVAREEWVRSVERQRMGGLWAIPDITGSVGVITVNVPRLVIESGFDDEAFYEKLDELLLSVKAGLLWMRERYHRMSRKFPHFYSMPLMYVPEVFSLRDGPYFNTIGVLGLPEAAALMARDPTLWFEGSRSARIKAAYWMRDVVQHIVRIARQWSTEVGTAFNVEEVPGESAAAKLAAKDARIYPELVEYLPEGEEGPVYSTSVAPYYGELSLWERVEVEEIVQKHFTGGVMMHIFLGEEPDPEALASLTKKLTYNSELVYWSYTPALTVCPHCGWRSVGMVITCPRCGSETEVWSRIIGYYRPLKNWNPARRREFWTRKHYRV